MNRNLLLTIAALSLAGSAAASARQWSFVGIPEPLEAELVTIKNGYALLRGPEGSGVEVPVTKFSPADRRYLQWLQADDSKKPPLVDPGKPITRRRDYTSRIAKSLDREFVSPSAGSELHVTGEGDPLTGSSVNFTATDGWLFLDRIAPSTVASTFLDRFLVNGRAAEPGVNVRLARFGPGCVVIPHQPDFPALRVFDSPKGAGKSKALRCHQKNGASHLAELNHAIRSFVLKRGYMATLAENADGTGVSRNYVAQDHDVVVDKLPKGLDGSVRFVRVFPWQWTGKKGIAGNIHQNINVDWFYNWNLNQNSSRDLEYVPIKQKRDWPSLNQDWKGRGSTHLLGFNEPDRPDQANMTVDEAIRAWPHLQKTGLRLGSPATSDGGLGWLYDFINKADRKGLRVDFVAVHYYRAVGDPGDGRAAAAQLYNYLEGIHERTKRPLWVTEWNNGANWTKARDPSPTEQKRAIAAMIEMLDETPFVERYALYNWVEDGRMLVRKDGSLTPAGEVYRDQVSPVAFVQPRSHH